MLCCNGLGIHGCADHHVDTELAICARIGIDRNDRRSGLERKERRALFERIELARDRSAPLREYTEHLAAFVDPYLLPGPRRIVEAVATAADGLGTSPSGIALSWLLGQPGISSAITGARTAHQLRHVLDELIDLPDAIDAVLSEVTARAS